MITKRLIYIIAFVMLAWFFFSLKFMLGLGIGVWIGMSEGLPIGRPK